MLSLKTKEFAVTLPVTIFVFELFFFEESFKKRILFLIPMFLMLVTVPLSYRIHRKTLVETTKVLASNSWLDYLFTQFPVIITYIRLLVFPVNQNLDYDYPVYDSFLNPSVILSFLFLISLAALGFFLFIRSRHKARGTRLASFGIFWFFITMVPESSLIPIADVVFEHRVYLPSVGAFIAIAISLIILFEKHKHAKAMFTIVPFLLAIIFSCATLSRNEVWKNELTLWTDIVKKSPQKARARNNLGLAYQNSGNIREAIVQYEFALLIAPEADMVHNNLGNAFSTLGDTEQAIEHYQVAIHLNPYHEAAHYDLGIAYLKKGDDDMARRQFIRVLEINPDNRRVQAILSGETLKN